MRTDALPRIAVSLCLASVLVLGACGSGPDPSTAPAAHSPVPARNAATIEGLPTDAQALPEATFDDYEALLGKLKGTPVVVNIWGSWCGPCREEADHLVAAAERYGDQVQFLGVDILDAPDSARVFMNEFKVPYPSLFDPSAGGDIRNRLGYLGQPVTIFYDAQGKKVGDWEGPITPEELDGRLRELTDGA